MLKFNFYFITTDYCTIFGKNFKLIYVMKKEFKGTQGSWVMYKPEHIGCENVALGELNGFNAYVELWHHHFDSVNEAKANAKLISKAPEMLAMLIKLRDKDEFEIEDHLDLTDLINEILD